MWSAFVLFSHLISFDEYIPFHFVGFVVRAVGLAVGTNVGWSYTQIPRHSAFTFFFFECYKLQWVLWITSWLWVSAVVAHYIKNMHVPCTKSKMYGSPLFVYVYALRTQTPNGTPDAHTRSRLAIRAPFIAQHENILFRFRGRCGTQICLSQLVSVSVNIFRSISFLFLFYRMEWKLILVRVVAAAVRLIQHNLMNTLFNFGASHTRPPRLVRHRVFKSTLRRYI